MTLPAPLLPALLATLIGGAAFAQTPPSPTPPAPAPAPSSPPMTEMPGSSGISPMPPRRDCERAPPSPTS
ncbi:hypothetical protein [Muricoccus pecuniae]|uniref:Uncharacterized protein n=1 Tax=Muricoccus pecuniae TaxID=693023 RepID=A0A840Y4E3_9PROT|nr:hypothetical protein [Roseomonas pecuniae]MBB5693649.1 hypothetical protein [Roseomonas pecuniae]